MARYRVLPSTAHNYAASFISVMHMVPQDYAMCAFLRAARANGAPEMRVNLLTGEIEPDGPWPDALLESVAAYCRGFGAHVQRSGSALDMVSAADVRVQIAWGRVVGAADPDGVFRARLHAVLTILDDRGREHVGRATEVWVCHEARGFY
jgi:hypothetical protein